MATRKKADATKVADTVSPDPADQADGGAPSDVTVIIPDVMEATTGGTGGTTGGAAPAPAPAPAVAPAPAAAPASTTPGGGPVAGEPHGYAAWVVPAPAPLATAAVGSSGYYMGIRAGVEDREAPFAAWLGTNGPRASWPNP